METQTILENSGIAVDLGNSQPDEVTMNVTHGDLFDIDINQAVPDGDPAYSELLPSALDPDYLPPLIVNHLKEMLWQSKVVVMHSDPNFDKGELAIFLAHQQLKKGLQERVFELQQNIDNQEILSSLRRFEDKCVFVLHDLHPKHIRYDFGRLVNWVNSSGHCLILTTEVDQSVWAIPHHLTDLHWANIPKSDLYAEEQLSELLCKKLDTHYETSYQESPGFSPGTVLKMALSISEVASSLKTPVQIGLFAHYYASNEEQISTESLPGLVRQMALEGEEFVGRWFFNLSHQERIIALGACMMDGVLDDQFFEALSEISKEGFWGKSVPDLAILDYYHLEFLRPFFRFEKTRDGIALHSRHSHLRTTLVSNLWNSHRRHLLSALPGMKKIVAQSLSRSQKNWELFGTPERRSLCRQAFEKAISDVGTIAFPAVEPTLLELAASGNYFIQLIAARAMARWREIGQDDLFFQTLHSWQTDERVQSLIEVHLTKRENILLKKGLNRNSSAYIRATAIMALAYAADYDSPNLLSDRIVDQLKGFAADEDPQVRERLKKVFPKFLQNHFLKLKPVLMDHFMIHGELVETISDGLAAAYISFQKDLTHAFEDWFEAVLKSASDKNRRQKFTQRDNVLSTLMLSLQKIELTHPHEEGISLSKVLNWCFQLLKQEKRQRLRQEIIQLLAHLQFQDFDIAKDNIVKTKNLLTVDERTILIAHWGKKYQHQRAELSEAPYEIEIGGLLYPAWISQEKRPLTPVEKSLFDWLESEDLTARQFATLAFLEFARAFEIEELAELEKLRQALEAEQRKIAQEAAASRRQRSISPPQKAALPKLSLWTLIHIFFLLLFETKQNKATLKLILLTLIRQRVYGRPEVRLVSKKWRMRSKGLPLKLANWLDKLY